MRADLYQIGYAGALLTTMRAMTVSEACASFGRALDAVVEDRVEGAISRRAGEGP